MGLRIVFMGTPDFAVTGLNAVQDFAQNNGHEIIAAYTRHPTAKGRGMQLTQTPVHQACDAAGIEVRTPQSLKDDATLDGFRALNADLAIVVAYGMILPPNWLDVPRLGCWNIHASLLPRWRGAAPIQRAIMAGDTHSGVSIMQMDAGLDTGAVLLKREVAIEADDTAASLHDRLAALGAEAIVAALRDAENLKPVPQSDDGVTYAEKIDKAEARLDFTRSATELARDIRGLSPFPGAWFEADGVRVKVLRADALQDEGTPATVADSGAIIYCGTGALQLIEVQKAGKAAMSGEALMHGRTLTPNQDIGQKT